MIPIKRIPIICSCGNKGEIVSHIEVEDSFILVLNIHCRHCHSNLFLYAKEYLGEDRYLYTDFQEDRLIEWDNIHNY